MENQMKQRMDGPPQSGWTRFVTTLLAVLVAALGGFLAAVMSLAALSEFLADDFFGVMVSGMVVVFGVLLFRSGYESITGRQSRSRSRDPLARRWEAVSRTYPYLPLSRLKADGR